MKTYRVDRVTISAEDKRLTSIKIAHISDLHLSTRHTLADIKSLIESINSIKADIVVITGDMIDTPFKKISHLIEPFKNLHSLTLFVSGNHDHVYGYKALLNALNRYGIVILDGKSIEFKGIEFVGVADRYAPLFGRKRDINNFINNLGLPKKPRIFLAHQPKDYKYALKAKSDLFLCGHTHGGQIYPFHYLVRLSQPFVDGLYYKDNMPIFVNRGIGTWGIHMRYKAPAHIAIIEFE